MKPINLINGDEPNEENFDKLRNEIVGCQIKKVRVGKKHNNIRLVLIKNKVQKLLYVCENFINLCDCTKDDTKMTEKDILAMGIVVKGKKQNGKSNKR